MVKTSKRARKFIAQGGVKGRLEKGTITKKGKLKHFQKNKKSEDNDDAKKKSRNELKLEREGEDMTAPSNLGDMDIDSFFRSVTEKDGEKGDVDDDVDDKEEKGKDDKEDAEGDDGSGSDDSDDDDDDSVGSGDEDIEDAERRMKEELEKLNKSDPSFHKFLSDNDKSLLEFGQDDDDDDDEDDVEMEGDDGDDDDEEDEEDKEEEKEQEMKETKEEVTKETNDSSNILLTAKRLKSYEEGAFSSHSLKGLKRIISAYRSACHLSDSAQNNVDADGRLIEKPVGKSYHIDSSAVFDRLMVLALQNCHAEFHYHLFGKGSGQKVEEEEDVEVDENKPLNPKHIAKAKHWNEIKKILLSFFRSTLHLLSEVKEPNLLKFVLQSLSKYTPYLTPLPTIAKTFLKTCTSLWSSSSDTSERYQSVRLQAFLRIRQLAITQPFPFVETTLKSSYLAYANRAKFGTASSLTTLLPTLTFMGNCIVELYSLDYASSYQHAFVYIRQLALHLRTALQKKTKESIRLVYCWQYVHCLKLWTAVLSSSCTGGGGGGSSGGKDDEAELMRSLIFPLTEIILGVIRLLPTTRYLPLRLHCVRLLQQLAATAELYIPTTSILLDVFDLRELYLNSKKVKGRGVGVSGVRLPLILKLPGDDPLRTSEETEACLSEVFLLLNRELDLYRFSAGFPEFTFRICKRLRDFVKATKNARWRAYAKGCIELCERYSEQIMEGRTNLNEAPKDIKRLEVLKPPTFPSMRERYEAFIAKEKRLEAVTTPAVASGKNNKANNNNKKGSKQKRDDEEDDDDDVVEEEKEVSRPKKKAKKRKVNELDLKNVGALEENDEVQEGINWSDDED